MPIVKLTTRASLITILAAFIAACSNYDYSNKIAVLPTSVVQVNTPLEIPAGEARIYIQNGKAIARRSGLDRFFTYCSFLMQDLHVPGEPVLTVSPGRFDVREVRQSNDRFNDSIILVASTMRMREGQPSNTFFTLEMRLRSTDQPDVRSLFCVKESGLRGRHYPTFNEINIALGDAVTIEPYQQQP
ncbi:MAG: hypothetical protein ACERLB_07445 [Gammaproteobacteria bacterium]